MITKETEDLDTYCIYANDFHLEMILLPYIKKNLQTKKIIILTENSLDESIKILLDRTNLSNDDKEKIYNLNWNNNVKDKINYIKNYNNQAFTIIIKGSYDFINQISEEFKNIEGKQFSVVRCYIMEEVREKNIRLDGLKLLKTERI